MDVVSLTSLTLGLPVAAGWGCGGIQGSLAEGDKTGADARAWSTGGALPSLSGYAEVPRWWHGLLEALDVGRCLAQPLISQGTDIL